ncbi:MAG TPA: DUF2089 family protein [Myxococcales bacterium]|nr:DUF2089 family protein [Myxococcales bacterium]
MPSSALKAFQSLDLADQELALQLISFSGSLKELAKHYGVSYPTIRQRLDRLISRLEATRSGQALDPMAEKLADLVDRGEMTMRAAKAALTLHREALEEERSSHD